MKKKVLKYLLVLLVLLIGYKLVVFYRYTIPRPSNFKEIQEGFKNYKRLKVTAKDLDENEYMYVGNFKMKNILEGYSIDEAISSPAAYKKEENGKRYVLNFGLLGSYQMIDYFSTDGMYFIDSKVGFLKGDPSKINGKKFLEKNNIKNDIDFYLYIKDNYFIKSNILMSTKTLKENYSFNLFVSTVAPEIDFWTILEGDITGYIFKASNSDLYEVAVIDNKLVYNFLTTDPRFNDEEFVKDLVSTIRID